jgi:ketosteroid isomerase-like protein
MLIIKHTQSKRLLNHLRRLQRDGEALIGLARMLTMIDESKWEIRVWRCLDKIVANPEAFDGALEDIRMVVDGEPIEAGDQVVVAMRLKGRGMETGIEVEQPAYMLWTFRDGRVLRVVVFADRRSAMEALRTDPDA